MKYLYAILAASLLLPGVSFAQADSTAAVRADMEERQAVGYRFGFLNENNDERGSGGEDIDYSHSISYTYIATRNVGYELETGVMTGDDGDDRAYSLFADLLFRYPVENFAPYIRAGLGFRHSDGYWDMFSNMDDSFAGRIGGGLELYINSNWAVHTELLFTSSGDDTADTWESRTGVKYFF